MLRLKSSKNLNKCISSKHVRRSTAHDENYHQVKENKIQSKMKSSKAAFASASKTNSIKTISSNKKTNPYEKASQMSQIQDANNRSILKSYQSNHKIFNQRISDCSNRFEAIGKYSSNMKSQLVHSGEKSLPVSSIDSSLMLEVFRNPQLFDDPKIL